MPAERYFVETELEEGASCFLEGSELHHLAHVMRAKVGMQIELVNGRGSLAEATVRSLGKREAELSVDSLEMSELPSQTLVLYQAVPRPNRLDTILEKGTELGVTCFALFPGERSERGLQEKQLGRLQGILVAALKQSGRLYLPELKLLPPIKKWSELSQPCYFGDVDEENKRLTPHEHASVVIGPESGLSEKEGERLRVLGAKGVTLHRNILRTDTAAIIACGLLSQ